MTRSNESDIQAILSHRYDNGGDFWASPDGRIYKGNPFSTIASLGMLHELDVGDDHEAVQGALNLILDAVRDDGRIRVAPGGPLYPCYTAEAARMLCRFGFTESTELQKTVDYLLGDSHPPGGWRCSFSRFGKGPETKYANPGATLYVLDVLRFFPQYVKGSDVANRAVALLLNHWDIKKPIGPCHWGIGSLFMQVEYPFLRYNLFYYLYVLSFYEMAKNDHRFHRALSILESKLNEDGEIIVERPHRKLKGLTFCAKNRPSKPATKRYREIEDNLRQPNSEGAPETR